MARRMGVDRGACVCVSVCCCSVPVRRVAAYPPCVPTVEGCRSVAAVGAGAVSWNPGCVSVHVCGCRSVSGAAVSVFTLVGCRSVAAVAVDEVSWGPTC
eukprot:7449493-Prorocentrum_lima.AAC.1